MAVGPSLLPNSALPQSFQSLLSGICLLYSSDPKQLWTCSASPGMLAYFLSFSLLPTLQIIPVLRAWPNHKIRDRKSLKSFCHFEILSTKARKDISFHIPVPGDLTGVKRTACINCLGWSPIHQKIIPLIIGSRDDIRWLH